jgi:hypothetical protein
LYWRLGWHAPFVFTIIVCAVDLLMRMLVIEHKDLPKTTPGDAQSEDGGPKTGDPTSPQDIDTADDHDTASANEKTELSPLGILVALAKSRRGLSGFAVTFVNVLIIGALEPT